MKKQHLKSLKAVNWWALAALISYMLFISWRLFFYAYTDNQRHIMQELSYNLVPFKTISDFILNTNKISFVVWTYNIAGNIAAFMPLGFLLASAFRRLNNWKNILGLSFILVFAAEMAQLLTRRGVFDVDDIILNMVGSTIGYFIYKIFKKKW